MSFFEIILVAVGLSMDTFAIAVCIGLNMTKYSIRKSLIVGLYFGIFQAIMPAIGFLAAIRFAEEIIAYDHWVAFALLTFLGAKMINGSFKKEEVSDKNGATLAPSKMIPLAIASSIDALAMGISFAFLKVNIAMAAWLIGLITLILSMIGVKAGNKFGARFKPKAEFIGGAILILIGFKILFEHLTHIQ